MSKLPEGFEPIGVDTSSLEGKNIRQIPGFSEIEYDPGPIVHPQNGNADQRPGGASQAEFVRTVEPAARRVAQRLNVPVEAVIGQWGLETGWGKSVIPGTNNYGNIKDFSGKGVAATDNMNGSRDKYRAYSSLDDFADDYANLIGSNGRYKGAVGAANTQQFFSALKQGGYAEDPNYAQSGVAASASAAKHLQQKTPAAPSQQNSAELPDLTGIPKWREIATSEKFSKLPDSEKSRVKNAYFDELMAPYVAAEGSDVAAEKAKFIGAQNPQPASLASRAVDAIKSAAGTIWEADKVIAQGLYDNLVPSTIRGVVDRAQKPDSIMSAVDGQSPGGVSASTLPLNPKARAQLEVAYNSSSPDQRLSIAKQPSVAGSFFDAKNKEYAPQDQNNAALSQVSGGVLRTSDLVDPRVESRANRLIAEGADASAAQSRAQTLARFGVAPGADGSISKSDFDFETQEAYKNSSPVIRAAVKGYEGYKQANLGILQAVAEAAGADDIAKGYAKGGADAQRTIDAIGDPANRGSRAFEGAVTSIAQQLPLLLAGAVTGSETLVLSNMAVQSFGQEYLQGRAKGLEKTDAGERASLFAAFEVIGEKFGLGNTLNAIKMSASGAPTKALISELAKGLAKEIPGEVLTTTGQFVTDKSEKFGLNQQAGWEDYLSQVADTISTTVLQSGMMMGGTSGTAAMARRVSQFSSPRVTDTASRVEPDFNAFHDPNQGTSAQNPSAPNIAAGAPNIAAGAPNIAAGAPNIQQAAPAPAARAEHPTEQLANSIVREMAEKSGLSVEMLLPASEIVPLAQAPVIQQTQQNAPQQVEAPQDGLADQQQADQSPEAREVSLWIKASDGTITPEEQAELSSLQQQAIRQGQQTQEDAQGGTEQASHGAVAGQRIENSGAVEEGVFSDQPALPGSSAGQVESVPEGNPLPNDASLTEQKPRTEKDARELRARRKAEAENSAAVLIQDQAPNDETARQAPLPRTEREARAMRSSGAPVDLLTFVNRNGGIASSLKSDIDQDAKLPGLFRKNGRSIDSLAELLEQHGYIGQNDIEAEGATSGGGLAMDMIQRAVSGERIYTPQGYEEVAARQAEVQHREHIRNQAKSLGINPIGKNSGKLAEMVEAEISRREAKESAEREALTEESRGLAEAMDQLVELFSASAPVVKWAMERAAQIAKETDAARRKAGYDAMSGAIKALVEKRQGEIAHADQQIEDSFNEHTTAAREDSGGSSEEPRRDDAGTAREGAGSRIENDRNQSDEGFALENQTEQDLAKKAARENDQDLADRQAADAQRDGFSLDAQSGGFAPTQQQSADMFGGPSVADFQASKERERQQAGRPAAVDLFAQLDVSKKSGNVSTSDGPVQNSAKTEQVATAEKTSDIQKGLQGVAQRQNNATNRFIESVVEQFGLSATDAGKAWDYFIKHKLVKVDAVGGQYTLKHGDLWSEQVMRDAANGVQSNNHQEAKPAQNKATGESVAETKATDQEKLAQDFRLYPDIVMGEIMQRGDLPKLLNGTGKRAISGFNAMRLEDRAAAYADYVARGAAPVEVPADYNAWARQQEAEIEQLRKDNDKPLAQQAEERRIAEGRPSYTEAQAQALRELGVKENAEGEPEATEEQWAEIDARTEAILRGDVQFDRVDQESPSARAETTAKQPETARAAQKSSAETKAQAAKIEDVGEKIGGARKDTAAKGGTRGRRVGMADETPTWRKRYVVMQDLRDMTIQEDQRPWVIFDKRKEKAVRNGYVRAEFKSEAEAEAALPGVEVARNHRVVATDGGFKIYRDVSDRKRVQVVGQTFGSRDEAMQYMVENAEKVIETKTSFGEEILPRPEKVLRSGAPRRDGDVTGHDLKETFGFRGVEFGNWNNQDERQEVMNHAYDALADLAEVLNIPARAIGLNGELALAFGARGHGLSGTRAHYELDYGAINLTKMKGAGSLAHEWFHSLDHFFGRQDGKTPATRAPNDRGDMVFGARDAESALASHGFKYAGSGVREKLREAYSALIKTMFHKAEKFVEDTQRSEKFVGAAKTDLAQELQSLREYLAKDLDPRYYKRNNKAASAEQLAAFDTIAEAMIAGESLTTEWRYNSQIGKTRAKVSGGRWTNDAMEQLGEIYKAVRGRSGFNAEKTGSLDSLRSYMSRYSERLKMLADAQASTEKTKTVPTDFAMDAKAIDQGRASDYWTTEHEMAARAFQAYVEDKLAEKDSKSYFLTYGTNKLVETPWGWARPYPAGEERKAINAAFDKLIETIETKDTEHGTAMFSRSESRTPPTTDAEGMRSTPISKANKLATVFSAIGKFEDAFQRETPQSTSMEDIAHEVMPGVTVKKLNEDLPEEWDTSGVPDTWEISTKDSGVRSGRFMSDGKHVWIDVSGLLPGKDLGSAMYAIASAYAYNNGQVFIGDPAGLSPVAFFRRLENMISSAIKYGTTDHLYPHPAQMNPETYFAKQHPDFAKAVEGLGLQWKQGDFDFNLKQMLLTSYNAAKRFMPGIEDIEYDFANGGFRRVSDDARVDREDLAYLPREDVGNGPEAGERYYAGSATAARAILTQSISRSQGTEAWSEILAGLRSQLRRRRLDHSLEKIFYSKSQEQIAREQFGNPNPKSTVEQVVKELGNQVRLGGKINVVQSALDLPAEERRQVFSSSHGDRGLQGVFFPDTGRSYLIADNLEPGEAFSTIMHEAGVHAGLRGLIGERGMNTLAVQIKGWARAGEGDQGRIAKKAASRIPEGTKDKNRDEELIAYFVTEAVKDGYGEPKPTASNAIERWFARLWSMVKAAIQKLDVKPESLTVDDIVALARGALERIDSERAGADGSQGPRPQYADLAGGSNAQTSGALPHQAALGLKGGETAGAWDIGAPSRMDNFIHAIQDRHVNLKRVQKAISESDVIPESFDAYTKESLYHGRVATRAHKFLDREMKPLLMDMKLKGVSMDELESFLWARHAKERNEQIRKINADMPDGGSGLTDAQVDAYLGGKDVLDSDGKLIVKGLSQDAAHQKRIKALAARVDAINAGTKQVLVQYGLETPETIAAWESTYQHYVPLQREEMEGATPIGQGFSVKGDASKRAMGSSKRVENILANLALQREAAITRGEKNRVALSVYGLALQNPNPDFWQVDKAPVRRVIDKKSGLVTDAINPNYKNQPNVLSVRIGGRDHAIVFNEHNERAAHVVESLKNLDVEQLNAAVRGIAYVTRYFASISTQYNPVFGIMNGIRDTWSAALNLTSTPLAGKQLAVLKNVPMAIRAIWRIENGKAAGNDFDDLYEAMRDDGGTTGYREVFRTGSDRAEALREELGAMDAGFAKRAARAVLETLDRYNTSIENATRLSAYKVARENGLTREASASLSKELTVNFNRKGKYGSFMGSLYAFFNAAVQGNARLLETLRGPAGARIFVGGVVLGIIQALIARAGFDDEKWEDVSEFEKQRNFIIPTGGGDYAKIPLPLGFNLLPTIGRDVAEMMLTGGKNAGTQFSSLFSAFIDSANPLGNATALQTFAPSIADIPAALYENKNFMGSPIAKEDANPNRPTPGFTRAKDSSSHLSRMLSEWINAAAGGTDYTPGQVGALIVSPTPDQLDYLFGGLTGGIGREANKLYKFAEKKLEGEEPKRRETPVFGNFFGTTNDDMLTSARFWRNVRELGTLENELKGRVRDRGEIEALFNEKPEAKIVKQADRIETQISKMRRNRHQIEFDERLPEDERTAQLKEMDEAIIQRMEGFNKMVREAKRGEAQD